MISAPQKNCSNSTARPRTPRIKFDNHWGLGLGIFKLWRVWASRLVSDFIIRHPISWLRGTQRWNFDFFWFAYRLATVKVNIEVLYLCCNGHYVRSNRYKSETMWLHLQTLHCKRYIWVNHLPIITPSKETAVTIATRTYETEIATSPEITAWLKHGARGVMGRWWWPNHHKHPNTSHRQNSMTGSWNCSVNCSSKTCHV